MVSHCNLHIQVGGFLNCNFKLAGKYISWCTLCKSLIIVCNGWRRISGKSRVRMSPWLAAVDIKSCPKRPVWCKKGANTSGSICTLPFWQINRRSLPCRHNLCWSRCSSCQQRLSWLTKRTTPELERQKECRAYLFQIGLFGLTFGLMCVQMTMPSEEIP